MIHLMRCARGGDRRALDRYIRLERAERTPAMVREIRGLLDAYGSITFAREYGRGLAGAALSAYDEAFALAPPSPDRDFIRAPVPYMLDRRV